MTPVSGEPTIAINVLLRPLQTIAPKPPFATPAPTMPPTNACELDEGMPASQVTMFHVIAPDSAPKMTASSIRSGETMPEPTVFATLKPKTKKAAKLKNAAHITAYCGFKTRVETIVAIELAASCRPFRKSNASATKIKNISETATPSISMNGRPLYRCSMTRPLMRFATS